MAGRRQDLETRIVADDQASKVIDKVAGELDQLEKRDTSIDLTADDQASADIRTLAQRLEGLSDEDKIIVLKAKTADAERDVDRLLKSLRNVDNLSDEEVKIRIDALGNARAELDQVQTELRDLDGTEAEIRVSAIGLDEITDSLGNIPGQLGQIAGAASSLGAGGALVAGAGAMAAALGTAALEAADMAIEAKTMADLTGDTVEGASRLQTIWKTSGADINDLNDVLLQMNGVLQDNPELAGQLGVNLEDGRSIGERFVEVIQRLDRFTGTASEKALIMSQVFGEEGVRQVAKLTTLVGTDLVQAMDKISDSQVMTDEDVDRAIELKAQVAEMTAQFQQMAVEIGQTIIPLMSDMVDLANDIKLPTFVEWSAQPLETFNGQLDRAKTSWHALVTEDLEGTVAKDLGKAAEATGELADLTDAELAALQKIVDIQKQHRAGIEAADKARQAAIKAAEEAYAEEVTQILGVTDALGDLAGEFEQMGVRQEALQSIFDLGNAPLDAAGRVRDIELAIDDLSKTAEELDLSEGLDPSNLKADALLDQLDSLRPQIQTKITEAFSTGGEEAALAMAHDYIAKVAEELGISEIEAAELMGLDDVLVKVKLGVEASDVENAKRQLELLTGLGGETPWTASIALALDTGTITGAEAQRMIQDKLRGEGVSIPAELVPKVTPHGKRKGQEDLDEVANGPDGRGRKAKIDPEVGPESKRKADDDIKTVTDPAKPRVAPIYAQASGLQAAEIALEQVARTRTADVYIVVHHPDGSTSGSTGGGSSGGPGFGPLAIGPTALAAPVPAVTSGGGYGALTIPVAAPSQPVVINNVLNAAVVGDPYAVARAMEDGTRRAARLMPRNQ